MYAMHSDHRYSAHYTPSSPLSPTMPSNGGLMSPPPLSRPRAGHSSQVPRRFYMEIPAHGFTFGDRSAVASPNSRVQSPAINLHRAPQPTPMELQHSLRRNQRDLIRQLKLSSQLAASPAACRPDAPRLDPLGSPKGAVTPLALEQHESGDYFALGGSGKFSPVASPGRSSRSEGSDPEKKKKKRDSLR